MAGFPLLGIRVSTFSAAETYAMRRSVDSIPTITLGLVFCLALTSFSAVGRAQSLFDQLYGRNSSEQSDRSELYQQGEDASYLASQTLWQSERVRALAATYGIEAALAEDQTIRSGDIISTSRGLMVFVVSRKPNGEHAGALVPLSKSPLRTQRRLQTLDEAVRRDSRAPQ